MSPGEGPGGAMTPRVVDGPLDPAGLARGTEDPASGALVVVTGARGGTDPADGGDGGEEGDGGESRPAGGDAGAEALDRSLDSIEDEALDRFAVRRCRLRVRADAPRGEPAVAAMVRAPHRGPAFDAARWAVASALERLPGCGGP